MLLDEWCMAILLCSAPGFKMNALAFLLQEVINDLFKWWQVYSLPFNLIIVDNLIPNWMLDTLFLLLVITFYLHLVLDVIVESSDKLLCCDIFVMYFMTSPQEWQFVEWELTESFNFYICSVIIFYFYWFSKQYF